MVTLGALGCTFIETRVENESVLLLVDTGASLTIISKKILDKLSRKHYRWIPFKSQSRTQVRWNINSLWTTQMLIRVGNKPYNVSVAIADIPMDGVLGLDFMSRNNWMTNVSEQRMVIVEENDTTFEEWALRMLQNCSCWKHKHPTATTNFLYLVAGTI
jgi:predicted aspartyl protease